MKIVCDACSAKYSISDDKVQGKVFKIRCKKCSNIIVVRGNAGGAAPAESTQLDKSTRVFDYGYDDQAGGEAVWHVVIEQDQVGPMTAADVQSRFRAGEIDAETYIWREGFADWLPVSQVEQFSAMFADQGAATDDSAGFVAAAASLPDSKGQSSGAAAVSDLFGGGPAAGAAADDDGDVFAARRPAAADNPSKLRGERGENSVLFSLSNLAQLASDAPRPQQSSSSSAASSSGAAQHGGGEGSGLIDIRSMASAYLGDKGSPKTASPSLGSPADLPVFTSTGFGEPAVMVPIVRSTAANNNRLLYGLVGVVGLLAVVAVVMVVVVLRGGDSKPAQVAVNTAGAVAGGPGEPSATPGAGTPASGTAATDGKTSADPAPAGASDPGVPAAGSAAQPESAPPVAAKDPAAATKRPERTTERSTDRTDPKKSTPTKSSTPTRAVVEDPPSKPSKPAKGDGGGDCDAVACLVDPSQPCCKKSGGAKPSSGSSGAKPDSSLPEQLDSSMIKAGIDKVKGRAQACGNKSSAKGAVKVRIKATPEGKVGSVDVLSSPDDALGSCVASALRGASFPKTQRGMGFAYTLTF
ncbi:MAG: zinc-ribbon domain-containing protein [Myxococcales bacterium]|nr:zinc-ribbon domain-containing protein [Myxococcales bacterium]